MLARGRPVRVDGAARNPEELCGPVDAPALQIPQLGDARGARMLALELSERRCQGIDVDERRPRIATLRVVDCTVRVREAHPRAPTTGAVDQHAPHDVRGDSDEVPARARPIVDSETEQRLVDERRGLGRGLDPLAPQELIGELTELRIDLRRKVQCRLELATPHLGRDRERTSRNHGVASWEEAM